MGRQRAIPIFWRSSETVSEVRTPVNVHTFSNPTINLPTQKPNIYFPFLFIYVIFIVCYVRDLEKIQKTEQPADTINNQKSKMLHFPWYLFCAARNTSKNTSKPAQ